jgi:hypothetical protein
VLALLQDLEGSQLTESLLEVVLTFAHTIDGLSHLPGAIDILNPAIHTAAKGFLALSAASAAQATQPPLAPTQDINNDNISRSSIDMQEPQELQLPSLYVKAFPASPVAKPQAVLSPAGIMPAQQANLSAPGTPVNNYNAFLPFSSLTEGNMGMGGFSGQGPSGVQGPRSKRLRTDSLKARLARASDNSQDLQSVVSVSSISIQCPCVRASFEDPCQTHSQHSPCTACSPACPAGQHHNLLLPNPFSTLHCCSALTAARYSPHAVCLLSFLQPLMARSPSASDIFDAAEVLASLTSSPMASAGSSTFFNQPSTLGFGQPSTLMFGPPSSLKFDALDELAAAAAAAPGVIARKAPRTPKAPKRSSDDVDWVAPRVSRKRSGAEAFAPQENPAPQAAPKKAAAPKPCTPRKVVGKSASSSYVSAPPAPWLFPHACWSVGNLLIGVQLNVPCAVILGHLWW